jgi:hypothetical protein
VVARCRLARLHLLLLKESLRTACNTRIQRGLKTGQRRVAPILGRRILASTILAVIFAVPIAASAQGMKKLVDTFEERYPTEQAPTPPSLEHVPTPAPAGQARPQRPTGHTKTHREAPSTRQEPPLPKSIAKVTRPARFIRAKRSLPRFVEFAFAAAPSSNAWLRPEWVVIRWNGGDCKAWHNDINAPAGYGWSVVALANTSDEAYWKMSRLYRRGVCVGYSASRPI